MAEGDDVHADTFNGEIEVKCVGLDISSHDLHNAAAVPVDSFNHHEDDDEEVKEDHTDNSYVFVNGPDVVNITDPDPNPNPNPCDPDHVHNLNLSSEPSNVHSNSSHEEEFEVQDGEIQVENVVSCEDGNCIVEVTPAANHIVPEEDSVVESYGDQLGSKDAVEEPNQTVTAPSEPEQVDTGEVKLEEEPSKVEASPEVEDTQICQPMVSEKAELELPRVDAGEVKDDENNNNVDSIAEEEVEIEQPQTTATQSVESQLYNGEQGGGEGDLMSESAIDIKENQHSEDIVSEEVQFDLDPDKELEELANQVPAEDPPVDNGVDIDPNLKMDSSPETNIQLESEVANCSTSNENGDCLNADHLEDGVSESVVIIDSIEGSQNAPGLDESSHSAESLILPDNCMRSEAEAGNVLIECDERLISGLDDNSTVPDNGTVASLSSGPSSAHDDLSPETEVENLDAKSGESILPRLVDDPKSEMEVENGLLNGGFISDRPADDVRSEPVIGNAINNHEEKESMLPSEDVSIKAELECDYSQPTSSPVDDPELETEVVNDLMDGDCVSGRLANDVRSEPVIGSAINLEEKTSTLPTEDVSIRLEVSNGVSECACGHPTFAHLNDSVEKESSLPISPVADVNSESVVEETPACSNGGDMPSRDASLSESNFLDGSVISIGSIRVPYVVDAENGDQSTAGDSDDKQICQENASVEGVHRDETVTISQEDSNANVSDCQDGSTDVVKRPFYFLIRVPRFDDENLRERIRNAQQQVEEKTQSRDAIRLEMQNERATLKEYHDNVEAAKSEARAAKELVKSKHQEIDSAQSVINIAKNATSVEDIDIKIRNIEHWMQHDTLSLKKEKEFIREIKQLKQLREQFTSSMGKQDVVQQALDQRDQIEERLRTLKKEMDLLREKSLKAEAVTQAARKKYHEESEKVNILQAKFKAADDIRQEAYSHLHSLRKNLSEKNKYFRAYKDAEKTARDYALAGNREALDLLCTNQVETFMEVYNKNDEYRKEYIRFNTRSTLRRLKTFDGRSLGPDEEPPVLPLVAIKRPDKSIDAQAGSNLVTSREQEKIVEPVQVQEADDKSMVKLVEQKDQIVKSKKPARPAPLDSGSETVSSNDRTKEAEEEHKPTKEEEELARKAEELRKQVEEAKLKEQRRLEEKAKAKEALERKKRISEKAQARAELKAKKEAEEKEKEREKRAKKKERKKTAIEEGKSGGIEGDSTPSAETPVEIVESGTREIPKKITRRPLKPSQFTKQTKSKYIPPPPLRNRGKRRMQAWMWGLLVALLLVVASFFVVKSGFLYKLGLPTFHF